MNDNKYVLKVMICFPSGPSMDDNDIVFRVIANLISDKVIERWKDSHSDIEELVAYYYSNNIANYMRPDIDSSEDPDAYDIMRIGNGISDIMPHCQVVVLDEHWTDSKECIIDAITALMYHKYIVEINRDEFGNIKLIDSNELKQKLLRYMQEVLNDETDQSTE
jgi:hypothetical protein